MLNPLQWLLKAVLSHFWVFGSEDPRDIEDARRIKRQALQSLLVVLMCIVAMAGLFYARIALAMRSLPQDGEAKADSQATIWTAMLGPPSDAHRSPPREPDQVPPGGVPPIPFTETDLQQRQQEEFARRAGVSVAFVHGLIDGFSQIRDLYEPVRLSSSEEQWLANLFESEKKADDLVLNVALRKYDETSRAIGGSRDAVLKGLQDGTVTTEMRQALTKASEITIDGYDGSGAGTGRGLFYEREADQKIRDALVSGTPVTKGDLLALVVDLRRRRNVIRELMLAANVFREVHAQLPLSVRREVFGLESAVIDPLDLLRRQDQDPEAIADFYENSARVIEGMVGIRRTAAPTVASSPSPPRPQAAPKLPVELPPARYYEPPNPEPRQWSAMLPAMSIIRRIEERDGRIRVLFKEKGQVDSPLDQERWIDASSLQPAEAAEVEKMLDEGWGGPSTPKKPTGTYLDGMNMQGANVPSPDASLYRSEDEMRAGTSTARVFVPDKPITRNWKDSQGIPLPRDLTSIEEKGGKIRARFFDSRLRENIWFPLEQISSEDQAEIRRILGQTN